VAVRAIAIGLYTHKRWLVQALLEGVAKRIANAGAQPAVENLHELLHERPLCGVIPSSAIHQKAEPVETPVPLGEFCAENAAGAVV
jgi:hypothetical protein